MLNRWCTAAAAAAAVTVDGLTGHIHGDHIDNVILFLVHLATDQLRGGIGHFAGNAQTAESFFHRIHTHVHFFIPPTIAVHDFTKQHFVGVQLNQLHGQIKSG